MGSKEPTVRYGSRKSVAVESNLGSGAGTPLQAVCAGASCVTPQCPSLRAVLGLLGDRARTEHSADVTTRRSSSSSIFGTY